MSSYKIYQIDHFDPKMAGQNVRRQIILSVVLSIILIFIFSFFLVVLKMTPVLLLIIIIPFIGFYIFYFSKLGSRIKNLKVIGEVEFTRTSIRKKIGDSVTEYYFHTVKKFELQKHLPTVGLSGTLSDNFTYILKIIFLNSSSESIVVSSQPIDTKLNISIVETMKTLKKIIEPEITIET
jgi:hypothetical protein